MLKKGNNKKITSGLLAVLYLFVALFSQQFHDHGSGLVFKDFHFKKTENTFSKAKMANEHSDCVACHIFNEGKSFIELSFEFKTLKLDAWCLLDSELQTLYLYKKRELFSLRGPPEI